MIKVFKNQNHFLYFALLILATIWLAALHWVTNPYKLAVWIYSSQSGSITIGSQCEGQDTIAQNNNQLVTEGYNQYELPLPKCRLSTIEISSTGKHDRPYEVSSVAITYYGKENHRLLGSKRTLEGAGIDDTHGWPSRAEAAVLTAPLVLNASGFNAADIHIWWPRFLPLFLLPFVWWFSRMLTGRQASAPEKNGASSVLAYLAVAAFSLITFMAVVARTDVSVHPDELTHAASAQYYYDHWLKPKIGAPETLDAHKTNVYGVAYLTGTDPAYQLAGKFAVAAWPIFENDVVALRMFNVALFGLLALMAIRVNDVRLALIPLLVTPQAWYIFSYFNGEGFPLFLSTLSIVYFLGLYKSDHPTDSHTSLRLAFIAGCLMGGVLLSKANYWTVLGVITLLSIAHGNYLTKEKFSLMSLGWLFTLFGIFLFLDNQISLPVIIRLLPVCIGICLLLWTGTLLIQSIVKQYKNKLIVAKPIVIMLIGVIAVLGLKMADEAWQNPLPFTTARAEALNAVRETTAMPDFKPSAMEKGSAAKTHNMRNQEIGLRYLLLEKTWIKTSITSFLGVYGNMNIWPTKYFSYALLFMFIMVTFSIFVLTGRRYDGSIGYPVPMSLLVGITTAIAASIGFSWFYDYQPQGKYLLPILPILAGGLLIADRHASRSKLLQWLVVVAFLLSATSFLFVGIQGIAQQSGMP